MNRSVYKSIVPELQVNSITRRLTEFKYSVHHKSFNLLYHGARKRCSSEVSPNGINPHITYKYIFMYIGNGELWQEEDEE